MFKDLVGMSAKRSSEDRTGLLNDRCVRYDVDHPIKLMRERVIECEREGREGLATARRNCERKDALRRGGGIAG